MSVQYALRDVIELLRELEPIVKKAENRGRYMPVIKWRASLNAYRIQYMAQIIECVLERYRKEADRVAKYRPGVSRHRTI
jgi:hypothetical protein